MDEHRSTAAENTFRTIGYVCMGVYFILVIFPLGWILLSSMKTNQEILRSPFGLPAALATPSAETWGYVIDKFAWAWTESHFSDYLLSSVKVALGSVGLTLLLAAPAAYVLARFVFRGSRFLFMLFVAGLMVPGQLVLIPIFFEYNLIGILLTNGVNAVSVPLGLGTYYVSLHNSHVGIIMIYVATALPFSVFVLANFMRTIPEDFREAGLMDGATEWTCFWRIMLPMARPGLVSVAIFNFLGVWNEYIYALTFLDDETKRTLPIGLASVSILSEYKSDYALMFAGLVITMVTIITVYVILQKHITRGVTLGALKG
jgi:N-acetylglucosamine transport system permease protein